MDAHAGLSDQEAAGGGIGVQPVVIHGLLIPLEYRVDLPHGSLYRFRPCLSGDVYRRSHHDEILPGTRV